MNKQVQKLLETFDDSKRGTAKLLARENITVQIVTGAPTASFDPVSRVLTIPNWPGLTLEQLDLLLGHEVGHALFTNTSYIEKVVKKPGLMTYWNVIEDTRIERKMKEAYPGLKRIFYNGYQQFHSAGPIFRGTKSGVYLDTNGREVLKKFADMKFIDRINSFYKIGAFVDIPFTPAEAKWLERINRCSSTEDAMTIAEALYKEQKEQNEQQKQSQQGDQQSSDDQKKSGQQQKSKAKKDKNAEKKQQQKQQSADAESEEDRESDESDSDDASGMDDSESEDPRAETDSADESEENDSDASDEDGDGDEASDSDDESDEDDDKSGGERSNQVDFPEETDPDPSALTDQQLQKALKKLADQQDTRVNVRHVLCKPLPEKTVKDRTVTAADWTKMTLDALGTSADMEKILLILEQKWNAQFLATAKHMALEFERRKTAKTLSNAKIAKTGRLNMNKLAMHKFTEDLFTRTLTVPQGKSHGIVMTIDASGSMSRVFPNVLDQVLLFAHFAFQCQIPFEAYMFTDVHHNTLPYHYEAESMGPLTLTLSGAGRVVGLINTADRRTFKNQVKCVLALRHYHSPDAEVLRNYPNAATTIGRTDNYNSYAPGRIPFARLGGTPLYAGMMLAERHVERMKRTLKLDKMTNVLITDGEDTNGIVYETQDVKRTGNIYDRFQRYDASGLVVRDTVTKKNHVLVNTTGYGMNCPQNAMLTLFFDIIKSRHDARNIMLFLAEGNAADTIHNSLPFLTRANEQPSISLQDVEKSIRNNRQFVMPEGKGPAELTLAVPTGELRLSENDFANSNTNGKTAAQVTKAFAESSVRAVSNRVFVNTTMPFLA